MNQMKNYLTLIFSLLLSIPSSAATLNGFLDWTAYEPWIDAPPAFIVLTDLDSSTEALIKEKVGLAEAVLFPPRPVAVANQPDPAAIAAREIELHRAKFPPAVTHRYYRERFSGDQVIRTLDETHSTDAENYLRRYQRRIESITPDNIASVIPQLESQIARDLRDIGQNHLPDNRPGRVATANRDWLLNLQPHLQGYKGIADRLAAAQKPSSPEQTRPTVLEEWQSFASRNIPLLRRIVESRTAAIYTVGPDGRYSHPAGRTVLIHFRIRGRDFYYPKEGPHQFRIFAETRTP